MAYTNSPMVSYTKLSPNHSGQRTHSIDRITPHCVVGQCSVETLGNIFLPVSRQASSNYGIGPDGRVGMYVEEKNRSWCSSSATNDQRAITIECASDNTEPYSFKDVVYKRLIEPCTDICRRNGKTKLLWLGDKGKTLNYTPKSDEMVLTVHRWFANKSCPGNWMYARNIIAKVKDTGVPVICCGEPMSEIVPGTTDAAMEKHVPVWTVENGIVHVKVGSVEHPMLPEHYIEWVSLHTKQGNQRKELHPGEKPEVCFAVCEGDEVEAVYAYYNLHSLWKA